MNIERLEDLKWYVEDEVYTQDVRADILALLDEAIARQSVKSEEVAEAIEIVAEWRDFLSGTIPADVGVTREIMSYNLAIAALQAYQPWISVDERLPDDINDYLIVIKHKYEREKKWHYAVDVATSNGSYLNNFWDTYNDWDEGQKIHVTHWQPLPEPPKEVEQ